jgi:hypothetical protein
MFYNEIYAYLISPVFARKPSFSSFPLLKRRIEEDFIVSEAES